jgi:hypothetical protein
MLRGRPSRARKRSDSRGTRAKSYPAYISNLKVKSVYLAFPKSTPNPEVFILKQQEEIEAHMYRIYSIVVEGYKADLIHAEEKLQQVLCKN